MDVYTKIEFTDEESLEDVDVSCVKEHIEILYGKDKYQELIQMVRDTERRVFLCSPMNKVIEEFEETLINRVARLPVRSTWADLKHDIQDCISYGTYEITKKVNTFYDKEW